MAAQNEIKNVLVAHRQKHHLYNTALAYKSINKLGAFYTEVYAADPRRLCLLTTVPLGKLSTLANKLATYSNKNLTESVWVHSESWLKTFLWKGLGARNVANTKISFERAVAEFAIQNEWAVHMCCGQAQSVFELVKEQGLPCILEQTTGHRAQGREILTEEFDRLGMTLQFDYLERSGFSEAKINQNSIELELADVIFVGSSFVANTLERANVSKNKVHLAGYGVDSALFAAKQNRRRVGERLEVAFVGNDFIRKGLIYLLQAAATIGPDHIHVNIFGNGPKENKAWKPYSHICTFHGSVPRTLLISMLQKCHVAVLPSLWEGSALATYETLAIGLPGIFTANTGSILQQGKQGFLIPIRSHEAITEALLELINEDLRIEMAKSALDLVGRTTWDNYMHDISRIFGPML